MKAIKEKLNRERGTNIGLLRKRTTDRNIGCTNVSRRRVCKFRYEKNTPIEYKHKVQLCVLSDVFMPVVLMAVVCTNDRYGGCSFDSF